jgi:hypothetical protein
MVLPGVNNLDIGDFDMAFSVETRAIGYACEQARLGRWCRRNGATDGGERS